MVDVIMSDDDYIQKTYDRRNRQNRFYMSKARAQFECQHLCKTETFQIPKLRTKKEKSQIASTKYYSKHKEMGLAKCRNCDYITATPIKFGARCPCCRNKFSRSIKKIETENGNK